MDTQSAAPSIQETSIHQENTVSSTEPTAWPQPTPWPEPTAWPQPTPWPKPTSWPLPPSPRVMGIHITAPLTSTLNAGEYLTLQAQVSWTDEVNSYQDIRWESTDPQIASINASGGVSAHQPGTVEIRAFATVDERYWHSILLTVAPHAYSLDGQVVYVKNNDLYLMESSNQNTRRLTSNGDTQSKRHPRFAWSGCEVIYATSERTIYRTQTQLQTVPEQVAVPVVLSADPMPYLWYNNDLIFRNWNALGGIAPGKPIVWSTSQGFVEGVGGITPLREIIFEHNWRIKYHRDLYNARVLNRDYGPGRHPRIALRSAPHLIAYEWEGNIQSVPFNEGPSTSLTQNPEWEDWPTVSPDEKHIVFVVESNGQTDLWMMKADGSERVNLTQTPDVNESFPDWGPPCEKS